MILIDIQLYNEICCEFLCGRKDNYNFFSIGFRVLVEWASAMGLNFRLRIIRSWIKAYKVIYNFYF